MVARQGWVSAAVMLGALGAAGTLGACGATTSAPAAHGVGHLALSSGSTSTTNGCGNQPTVSATATGRTSVTPDTLTMLLGVTTHANSAQVALNSNNTKTTALLSVLRKAGVPENDLQTTGLSINPHYVKNGKVSGYQVNNTVTATVTTLSSAGAIIDSAASEVGNGIQFDNLQFSISDDSAPALSARTMAVKTAEARAQAMAAAAGVTLGPVCAISDQGSYDPIYGNSGYFGFGGGSAASSSGTSGSVPVPVEPGTQQVAATVTVTYGIQGGGTGA